MGALPHTPTVDLSHDGQSLAPQWDDLGNNVCGAASCTAAEAPRRFEDPTFSVVR